MKPIAGLALGGASDRKEITNGMEKTDKKLPAAAAEESDEFTIEKARLHRIQKPIRSIAALYDEFYGLGKYDGVPVDGGIFGLEKIYPPRGRVGGWRRDFGKTYQKHYSRCRFIVCGVHKMAGGDDRGVDSTSLVSALREVQGVFENVNKQISKVERYCRDKGGLDGGDKGAGS